jgi:glucose/arabinose dehydrogenase
MIHRVLGVIAVLLAGSGRSQSLSYPGCPDVQAGEFRKTPVADFTGSGRTKFAIASDGRIVAAGGNATISIFDPKTSTQTDAGKIAGAGFGIWGIAGLALDPAFTENGHLFIYSTRPLEGDSQVSSIRRYTLKDGILDTASMKTLLEWGLQRNNIDHSGGGMGFDAAGNLYVGTGENAWYSLMYANINETDITFNALRSAANTNDLRGKILRIKPLPLDDAAPAPPPGPGSTYEIPAGNLFPVGLEGTRPEIYIMGNRNPFTLTLDAATGWLFWADVGPNATTASADKGPAGMEEFNVAAQAGNYGWPMFVGPNLPYPKYDYAAKKTGPVFDSLHNPWTGFTTGSEIVPIAGPVYRYNGAQTAAYRLPPHFDGRWIIGDYYMHWIKAVAFDATGRTALDVQPVFTDLTFSSLVDMKLGPDGGLYVMENGTQLVSRIEYTGSCLPKTEGLRNAWARGRAYRPALTLGRRLLTVPEGFAGFRLFDPDGRKVWTFRRNPGRGPAEAYLPAGLESRMLLVRWDGEESTGKHAPGQTEE